MHAYVLTSTHALYELDCEQIQHTGSRAAAAEDRGEPSHASLACCMCSYRISAPCWCCQHSGRSNCSERLLQGLGATGTIGASKSLAQRTLRPDDPGNPRSIGRSEQVLRGRLHQIGRSNCSEKLLQGLLGARRRQRRDQADRHLLHVSQGLGTLAPSLSATFLAPSCSRHGLATRGRCGHRRCFASRRLAEIWAAGSTSSLCEGTLSIERGLRDRLRPRFGGVQRGWQQEHVICCKELAGSLASGHQEARERFLLEMFRVEPGRLSLSGVLFISFAADTGHACGAADSPCHTDTQVLMECVHFMSYCRT
jgi:hypothetical protein